MRGRCDRRTGSAPLACRTWHASACSATKRPSPSTCTQPCSLMLLQQLAGQPAGNKCCPAWAVAPAQARHSKHRARPGHAVQVLERVRAPRRAARRAWNMARLERASTASGSWCAARGRRRTAPASGGPGCSASAASSVRLWKRRTAAPRKRTRARAPAAHARRALTCRPNLTLADAAGADVPPCLSPVERGQALTCCPAVPVPSAAGADVPPCPTPAEHGTRRRADLPQPCRARHAPTCRPAPALPSAARADVPPCTTPIARGGH